MSLSSYTPVQQNCEFDVITALIATLIAMVYYISENQKFSQSLKVI